MLERKIETGSVIIKGKSIPEKQYPIRPEHINALCCCWYELSYDETEISARWIVRFCQKQKSWKSLTKAGIEKFYRQNSEYQNFSFNQLVSRNNNHAAIRLIDGRYFITHEFIASCFK